MPNRMMCSVRWGDSCASSSAVTSQPSAISSRTMSGHVQGGVEHHAVGQQGVELDDLLLLAGVIVGDDAGVADPRPGGDPVVGLDPKLTITVSLTLPLPARPALCLSAYQHPR